MQGRHGGPVLTERIEALNAAQSPTVTPSAALQTSVTAWERSTKMMNHTNDYRVSSPKNDNSVINFSPSYYHIRKQRMLFCVSSTVTRIHCLRLDLNVNNEFEYIRCIRCFCMWYSPKWRYGVTRWRWILNKVILFGFFAFEKYSRNFVKLRLNPWWHMNYFTDLLAMFRCLDPCCLRRVRELSDFIKNILICVLKMNGGLTGLARHEDE